MIELVVPEDCAPMRLDRFVTGHVPGVSRRRLHGASLRLNGRPAKLAAQVYPGDRISLPDSLLPLGDLPPNPSLSLPILYSDEALVAVDKRAGLASVALRAEQLDTVANFLVAAFPETRNAGNPLEGGLVQRLDHDTSGVLVAARSPEAYAELRRQFSGKTVEKQYMALVFGDVAEAGGADASIAHDRRHPERMLACPDEATAERLAARPAVTRWRPVVRYGRATLLRVKMRSGVRHQVRVHLALAGHPIAGDALYGHPAPLWIKRQALHASGVKLTHPGSGRRLEIESPLPEDFEAALKRLKR